jgi:hypothetical protein
MATPLLGAPAPKSGSASSEPTLPCFRSGSLGFTETGETKTYRYGPVLSEIVILTKKLLP